MGSDTRQRITLELERVGVIARREWLPGEQCAKMLPIHETAAKAMLSFVIGLIGHQSAVVFICFDLQTMESRVVDV